MPTLIRPTLALAILALGALAPGCARDRSQITPTTSGTDLRNIPRGRMTPQAFPGSSLARAGQGDPATIAAKASGEAPGR